MMKVKNERSEHCHGMNVHSNGFMRLALKVLGTFFVVLGFIGIFVPLLPTTPFLLLATACYAKSSLRFYNWLMTNRIFGRYIKNYMEGRGIPLRSKIISISFLTAAIGYSILFVVPVLAGKFILILIYIGVCWHIISLPTLKK
ncbi:MAG: hypothetical protein A7316_03915 [Candidatus Altiarchaeales archaeon WOR_SM1_86-2]|nr:MAG: hypothetical protein A7315_05725 [Candidatus Altiarchaeales archaeon WOR_SM1_79]ODS35358.1 MAG: hypothetical protein A7316_03915 [Candidatus Altiarchaeales archaeon WOR_SM1_86-2]